MKIDKKVLDITQRNTLALLQLYAQYGYTQYKMSKFEEYELYSKNKGFLVNDSVITFTDTDGKLMALKPDVTLSIIKNTDRALPYVQKYFYNESVYRVSKHSGCFKEVRQVGLECFGKVDNYNISEVLLLAAKSLQIFKERFVLEVSHLGLMSAFIRRVSVEQALVKRIWKCVNEKNFHSILELCRENDIDEQAAKPLQQLLKLSGSPQEILPQLETLAAAYGAEEEVRELENALSVFCSNEWENNIIIDFSAVGNTNYYNGIIFNGFVDGVPESVLSGGQYDALMHKMKKQSKAIGFAVYLELLERLEGDDDGCDADVMLVYADSCMAGEITRAVDTFLQQGKTVFACSEKNPKLTAREYYYLEKGRLSALENNA